MGDVMWGGGGGSRGRVALRDGRAGNRIESKR